jgi:hypothetical protein
MKHLASVTLKVQSSYSMGTAHLLVGHGNVMRVDPSVHQNRFGLDTLRDLDDLCGLGETEARKQIDEIGTRFFGEPVEPFVPYESL